VITWLPVEDAPIFQRRVSELIEAIRLERVGATRYVPPYDRSNGPQDAWELPGWMDDDGPVARWLLSDLGPNQRRILVSIVAAGREGVWTGDLKRAAGYDDSTSNSGIFKAIGGRFRRVGRRPIWNGGEKDTRRGQRLTAKDDIARELFRTIIRDEYPELAAEAGLVD
jgi:hypothetical protein